MSAGGNRTRVRPVPAAVRAAGTRVAETAAGLTCVERDGCRGGVPGG